MAQVQSWTGLEAVALRKALRDSVRGFAERLGVAPRTVGKWGKLMTTTTPYPDTQAILDTVLARADPAVHLRFEAIVAELRRAGAEGSVPVARSSANVDFEAWAEDLDRAVVALSWQNFRHAGELLNRWLASLDPDQLDDRGLYLYGRSLTLLGTTTATRARCSDRGRRRRSIARLAACSPSSTSPAVSHRSTCRSR